VPAVVEASRLEVGDAAARGDAELGHEDGLPAVVVLERLEIARVAEAAFPVAPVVVGGLEV